MDETKVDEVYALRERYAENMDTAVGDAEYYQAYAAFGAVCEVIELLGL